MKLFRRRPESAPDSRLAALDSVRAVYLGVPKGEHVLPNGALLELGGGRIVEKRIREQQVGPVRSLTYDIRRNYIFNLDGNLVDADAHGGAENVGRDTEGHALVPADELRATQQLLEQVRPNISS